MKAKVTLSLNKKTVAMLRKADVRKAMSMSAIVKERTVLSVRTWKIQLGSSVFQRRPLTTARVHVHGSS